VAKVMGAALEGLVGAEDADADADADACSWDARASIETSFVERGVADGDVSRLPGEGLMVSRP
jgi:hypothetical protein